MPFIPRAVVQTGVGDIAQIATFSHTGTLVVTAGVGRYLLPGAITVTGVIAAVNTAPTGAAVICDVNKNGTTIFTTQGNRPTIAATSFATSVTAIPDITSIAAGDYLSVDIDQIGSTIPGSDLVVQVIYRVA